MEKEIVGKTSTGTLVGFEPSMMNRHGMIAGATGSGKTVTVRLLVERLSALGTHCFLADVKGDLSGIAFEGTQSEKLSERLKMLSLKEIEFRNFPVHFWDPFAEAGIPLRTTISELGPTLLSRLLNLNEVQTGVVQIAFKVADKEKLLLIDLKDFRSILQYLSENAKSISSEYGNISATSVAAIQRSLLALEEEGATTFFGETAISISDLIDNKDSGSVHVVVADKLIEKPKTYATLLLYILSELYEELPEVGDVEVPKFAFFFDEAHLLFDDCPDVLLEKIEQVVRLIRSKGVGVFFISQSITDIPPKILAQLGNRIQHAVRAFTDKERKSIKGIAENFRADGFDVAAALTSLSVGEAVVSFLEKDGKPAIASRTLMYPPQSRFQPASNDERKTYLGKDRLFPKYSEAVDPESAYELLAKRKTVLGTDSRDETTQTVKLAKASTAQSPLTAFFTSAARAVGSQVGRAIVRGIMDSLTKSRR